MVESCSSYAFISSRARRAAQIRVSMSSFFLLGRRANRGQHPAVAAVMIFVCLRVAAPP
jgi:hypothetical protein